MGRKKSRAASRAERAARWAELRAQEELRARALAEEWARAGRVGKPPTPIDEVLAARERDEVVAELVRSRAPRPVQGKSVGARAGLPGLGRRR